MTLARVTKAKLNLSLNMVGKRADGYHLLHSVVAFCEVGDTLSISPADTLSLTVDGPFAEGIGRPEDNLVMRAARLLQQASGIKGGAHITLTKQLPLASGIGSGSGDAATALLLLCDLWDIHFSPGELASLGAALGADVPVCLHGKACVMEGVGERITPLAEPWPELYAVLVNPLIPLSTPEVFKGLSAEEWTTPLYDTLNVGRFTNDLQKSAIRLCPAIEPILAALAETQGLVAARLSGSGATCFGIYSTDIQAAHGAALMRAQFPYYWIAHGRLS